MSFFKNRKNIFLLIGFTAALILALFSFSRGILQFGHRDAGYYDVGLTDEGNAVLYGSGTHLIYYSEGSSSQIRLELNRIQKIFSDVLLGTYKMLDAKQTWEGIPNIASLNQNPGKEIEIGETLYGVLADSLVRSDRQKGYNIFAGPLFREWEALLYVNDPSDFDPTHNPDETERLSSLTEMIQDPNMFSVELTAPDKAVLRISPEYREFAEELEPDTPVLDLNLLHDAWLLRLTAEGLKAQGVTNGYLYSESGCSIWLDSGDRSFTLYGWNGDSAAEAGSIRLEAPLAYCQLTAFPITEDRMGYYQLENEEEILLRHPFIDSLSGEPGKNVKYAVLSGSPDHIVDLAYELAVLNSSESSEEATEILNTLPEDIFAVLSLSKSEQQLLLRKKDAEQVTLSPDSPYSIGFMP